VLLHQVALAAGMTLYLKLAFDAEKDFVTIGLIKQPPLRPWRRVRRCRRAISPSW